MRNNKRTNIGIVKMIAVLFLAVCMMTGTFTKTVQATPAAGQGLDAKVSEIVSKKVKSSDSGKKKLKKLFTYIQKQYDYGRKVGFEAYNGWEKDYALEMLNDKKGSCYHYAAAYAFLAKKATGYNVRIGVGQTNGFSGSFQPHAWVEVEMNSKWYICDPNMDKYAADSSKKYCVKKRNSLKDTYNKFKDTKYYNL